MLTYTVFRELISIALPKTLTNRLTNQISHNAGEVTRALEPGQIPDNGLPQVSSYIALEATPRIPSCSTKSHRAVSSVSPPTLMNAR